MFYTNMLIFYPPSINQYLGIILFTVGARGGTAAVVSVLYVHYLVLYAGCDSEINALEFFKRHYYVKNCVSYEFDRLKGCDAQLCSYDRLKG